MNTKFQSIATSNRAIAYVRPVKVADLPEDVRAQLQGTERMYGIYHEDGDQLAVVSDRSLAFIMARQNDFEPVSVH